MKLAKASRQQWTGRNPVDSCPNPVAGRRGGAKPETAFGPSEGESAGETWLRPDLVENLPGPLDDPDFRADVLLAHRTRGEAYRDGQLKTPEAIELIELSDDLAMAWPGSHYLRRRRVYGVARHLSGVIPVEVIAPGRLSCPPFTSIIGIVRDALAWCSIPAYEKDPVGEFEDRPVPVADDLDLFEALALTSATYATFARARRADAEFISSLVSTRSAYRYTWRPLLRWLAAGRVGREDEEE